MLPGTTLNSGTTFYNSPDFVPGSEWGFGSNFCDDETIETEFMLTNNLLTGENGLGEKFNEHLSMDLVEKIDLFNPCVGNHTQSFPFTTFEELGNDLQSSPQDNAQEVLEQNSCTSNTESSPKASRKRRRKPSIDTKKTLNASKKPKKDRYFEYRKNYREAEKNYDIYLEERVKNLFKTFIGLWDQMKAKHQNSLQPPAQDMLQKSFNELRESLRPLDFSSWKIKNNVPSFTDSAKIKLNLKNSTYYKDIHDRYNNYKIVLIDNLFKKINEGRALLGLPEVIGVSTVSFDEFRKYIKNKDYPISSSQTQSLTQSSNQENQKYILKDKKNIKAIAYLLWDNSLLVKKDSEACMMEPQSLKKCYSKIRQKLVKDMVLIPEKGRYIFTSDYIFKSPTFAASAILGSSVSGKKYWKNESGLSIEQVESKKWL